MTDRSLERRVEFWRRRLIPEWRIALTLGEPDSAVDGDDEWVACVASNLAIGEVRLYVRPEVLTLPRVEVDRIVVHELVHVMLDRVLDHADSFRPFVGEVAWEVWTDRRRGDMEEFVNRAAHLIIDGSVPPYGTKRVESGARNG